MAQSLTTNMEPGSNLHLCFELDEKTYAINTSCVMEVIMLPALSTPQKLPENIVGILNYNSILINVIDIRKILNLPVKAYEPSNQVIIIKGEESLIAVIADKVSDFFSANPGNIQPTSFDLNKSLIKSFYHSNEKIINILNPISLENALKQSKGNESSIDYPKLFPSDALSTAKLTKRAADIASKINFNLDTDFFSKDQYIIFKINSHTYCLDSSYVKELINIKNYTITKIPYTPEYLKGIINLKGDFYTVVSLKEFIQFNEYNKIKEEKIIVLEAKDLRLALLVDDILDAVSVSKDQIHNKNDIKLEDMYIKAEIYYDNKVYNLLDIERLLNDKKLYIE